MVAFTLPPMPSVQTLVRIFGLSARKQLSQNFLFDRNITDKVTRFGNVTGRRVLEIGPGPGCLTRSILNHSPSKCWGVELDQRFEPALRMLTEAAPDCFSVYYEDILKFDYSKCEVDVIMGNLPYQISSPLLVDFAKKHHAGVAPFLRDAPVPVVPLPTLVLMFQEEVADRIHAPSGVEHRARISVVTQAFFETKVPMYVRAASYVPKPKVDGGVVLLTPRPNPHIVGDSAFDFDVFQQVITAAFNQPRKKLRVPLARIAKTLEATSEDLLVEAGLNPDIRVRYVEADEYKMLAVVIARRRAAQDTPRQDATGHN